MVLVVQKTIKASQITHVMQHMFKISNIYKNFCHISSASSEYQTNHMCAT